MSQAYDLFADDYDKSFQLLPLRNYVEAHSVRDNLGDVKGCAALDVACGTGIYSRLLRRMGAARVIGVDLSPDMIRVAQAAEKETGLGIEYRATDAMQLPALGPFDLVLGVYLLHYAPTREGLAAMCQGVARNLKKGGRFLTFVMNPELSPELSIYHKYDFFMRIPDRESEGGPLYFSVKLGEAQSPEFTAYHYSKTSLESALREAGFTAITWKRPTVAPEGVQRFGQAYWDDYLRSPHCIFIDCRLQ